jgi:uncharacterized protein (TIGR02453 family)
MNRNPKNLSHFMGFSPSLFDFLQELASNNSKDWFNRNRFRYKLDVLTPIKAFVRDLGPVVGLLNTDLETTPLVGKTISRINNDIRFHKGRPPYRPFIYTTFLRPGPKWSTEALLYVGLFDHGVSVGFYPGGDKQLKAAPLQNAIKNNSKLFQRYLSERRIAERYVELAGGEQGGSTSWPLPKTARKWMSMDGFIIGEYVPRQDPLLAHRPFLHRVEEIMIDLYPLWIFAASEDVQRDFDLYQENARLLSNPLTKAGD